MTWMREGLNIFKSKIGHVTNRLVNSTLRQDK